MSDEKRCNKCLEVKPIKRFHRNRLLKSGRVGVCDACRAEAAKIYRGAHKAEAAIQAAKWAKLNAEHIKKVQKKYRKTKAGKKMMLEAHRKFRREHPEKNRAVWMVGYAIERGILVRQPCEICGELKVEAHHEDYAKPLDVKWLCSMHHRMTHGKSR